MTTSIYLILVLLFLIIIFVIIYLQILYLIKNPNQYQKDYNGHSLLITMSSATTRYFLRRGHIYLKFFGQYLLHFWVKFLSLISSLFDKIYTLSRNKFVRTAVINKGTVPHFWQSLKKYKKEIDQEKDQDLKI